MSTSTLHPFPSAQAETWFRIHPLGYVVERPLSFGAEVIHLRLDTLLEVATRLEADCRFAAARGLPHVHELAQTRMTQFRRTFRLYEAILAADAIPHQGREP